MNAKKILITTESHEIFVLRTDRRDRAYGHCRECDREVEIVTLDQAISISGIRTRDLVRMAEISEIHAIETETGHLLVCKDSLTAGTEPTERSSNESHKSHGTSE